MTAPTASTASRTADPAAAEVPGARSGLFTAFQVTTTLLALLVLVQAALAGQSLFGTGDIAVHGYIGNASFLLGLAALILAVVARAPRWLIATAAVLVVLLFVQTGLGYAGRQSNGAASAHIPLGVATFGAATVAATGAALSARRR